MNERKLRQLTELSKEARQLLTKMIGQIGVGHVGGSLSLIEALVYLYYEEMRVRPEEPGWPDRDRIVLSKGHAGPALYTLLAMKGYFDKETLLTLNQPGTRLPSHCDMKLTTGIDMTAGSLGQGLSAAVYTQLSDVEDEVNGLFTYDRQAIKPDPAAVRAVNEALEAEFEKVLNQA